MYKRVVLLVVLVLFAGCIGITPGTYRVSTYINGGLVVGGVLCLAAGANINGREPIVDDNAVLAVGGLSLLFGLSGFVGTYLVAWIMDADPVATPPRPPR